MSEKQLNRNISSEQDKLLNDEMEIDLMDILRKIISIRKTLYKAAGIGLIMGIIVAFSIPKQYTVKVTLSPEMGNSKGTNGIAGLAASFLGSGATIGDGTDALNASLSSDIVSSTPFLLELLDMNVPSAKKVEQTSLEYYLEEQSSAWWSYVMGIPGLVISGIKSLFEDENKEYIDKTNNNPIELTQKTSKKIKILKKNIIASVDKKTAITNVVVTLQDPRIAAVVADSVVHKLQEYIIGYRTSKAKEDCIYLEMLFKERQDEYYDAQRKYAEYVDTHDNLILQSVRAEQERLQNDMSLAYQVYSQVANQLQVARAKVQEEKPVFAVVEPAVIPLNSSGISLKIYVLVSIFLSVISVIVWNLMGKNFWSTLMGKVND